MLSYFNPLNVFQKKQTQQEQYEIFSFEYTGSDYLPMFEKFQKNPEREYADIHLHEIEDIYLGNYHLLKKIQTEESNLVDYIVAEDDTLFGLELKFNVSQNRILKINDISADSLIPGMRIRVPNIQLEQIEETEQKTQSFFGRNLMDEIMAKGITKKFQVYYLASPGNIEGVLTVNQDIILFDPNINEQNAQYAANNKKSIIQFQACIMTNDLVSVEMISLPMRIAKLSNISWKDYIIKLTITHHPSKRRKSELEQIQMNFRVYLSLNQIASDVDYPTKSAELLSSIQDIIVSLKSTSDNDLTVIPSVDHGIDEKELISRVLSIWGGQEFIPELLEPSKILEQDQLVQIVAHIPSIFKTINWKLLFSNLKHGSSYQTFLSNCEMNSPLIVVIKDFDKKVFGAYVSEQIKLHFGKFYGTGETFLFKFDDFEVFRWTEKNNDFIFCEQDGFAIGCGDKFGLYVNNTLRNGNSQRCDTFDNQQLSGSQDFNIEVIEIWGIDD